MNEKLAFRDKFNGNPVFSIVAIVLGALLIASGVLGVIGSVSNFGYYSFYHLTYKLPEAVAFLCWAVMGIFVIRWGCKPAAADFRGLSTVAIIFCFVDAADADQHHIYGDQLWFVVGAGAPCCNFDCGGCACGTGGCEYQPG